MKRRRPDLKRQAGKSRAGSDVKCGHGGIAVWKKLARGKEGFSKVSGDDFFWIADRRQIDFRVPLQQQIQIRRNEFELAIRKGIGAEEWSEQFADSILSHAPCIVAKSKIRSCESLKTKINRRFTRRRTNLVTSGKPGGNSGLQRRAENPLRCQNQTQGGAVCEAKQNGK